MLHRLAVALCAAALAPVAAAQQFTYDNTALPAQSIWTDGVELVDVDADGDVDILFANGSAYGGVGAAGAQPQHLFLNNGAGVFSAAHAQLNVANFNAKLVVADDLDGDGDPDLAYASGSTGSPPRVLLNDGTGHFTDVTATNVPALALRSFAIATGDVDNDGDLDLAVSDGGTFAGIAAQARLLLNDGNAVFTDVTAAQLPVDLYNCQDITFIDFDLDGDVDMALSGKGGANKRGMLYLNDGSGTFSVSTGTLEAVGTGSTYEIDWADFDGDGDFDAAVQSISGFSEGWARNDGYVPMVKTTFPAPNGNDDNEMAGLDYDNDGDIDVFVGSLGNTEKAYRNDGGVFVNVNAILQAQADATLDMGFADLDGDGDYDLVTAQGESGNFTNKVYRNAGPADTLGPVLVAAHVPAGLGAPETVVRLQLADAIADDGHIGCTVAFSYTLQPSGAGARLATSMGGGLYRLAVPTAPGSTALTLEWTATDGAGNVTVGAPIVLGASGPWTDLGFALAGSGGVEPELVGTGTLLVGDPVSMTLFGAAPSAPAILYISDAGAPTPFKGGTLLPVPPMYWLNLLTDPTGQVMLAFGLMPPGAQGLSFFVQAAITDAGAVQGVSLSNALRADIP